MLNLSLFTSLTSEEEVFYLLKHSFVTVLQKNNANPNKLQIKRGKSYSSVWFDTQMAFRICCRNEICYFGFSNSHKKHIPKHLVSCIIENPKANDFINLSFEPTVEHINSFIDLLSTILDFSIDSIPKQFDCCSRYSECSDAKHCIHPDPDVAVTCGYRKILKKGKIYYGNNRNV